MRKHLLASIGVAGIVGCTTYAADVPSTNGAANARAAKPESPLAADPVVCKTYPPPIGTLIGERRICHTESEWRQITNDSQDATKDLQTRAATGRLPGN